MRPTILDLYCASGGAAWGYHQAGWNVVGVDVEPQPNYPFEFIEADALEHEHNWPRYQAVHASPPCQFATAYRRRGAEVAADAESLIGQTRDMLRATGLPYVIENVDQAEARAELLDPFRLCGSSFGLNIRRHRLFESNQWMMVPGCDHSWQEPRFAPAGNRTNQRSTVEIGVWRIPKAVQQEAIGIDWMTIAELSLAIPPAYTRFIGTQILDRI